MPIIKCPECGHQVSSLAETCPSCGVAIAGNITKCEKCGSTMLSNQEFCPHCLHAVHASNKDGCVSPVMATAFDTTSGSNLEAKTGGDDSSQQQTQQRQKTSKAWMVLVVALVIALAIFFIGYYFYRSTQEQNEIAAYENAMLSTEPAVLQNYLDMYIEAPKARRDSVTAHLEILKQIDLDWTNAVASRSEIELERYMKKHPDSIHNLEAKFMIDSLDWISAANENTMAAYRRYMEQHADGQYIDDAKANYDRLDTIRTVLPTESDSIKASSTAVEVEKTKK